MSEAQLTPDLLRRIHTLFDDDHIDRLISEMQEGVYISELKNFSPLANYFYELSMVIANIDQDDLYPYDEEPDDSVFKVSFFAYLIGGYVRDIGKYGSVTAFTFRKIQTMFYQSLDVFNGLDMENTHYLQIGVLIMYISLIMFDILKYCCGYNADEMKPCRQN